MHSPDGLILSFVGLVIVSLGGFLLWHLFRPRRRPDYSEMNAESKYTRIILKKMENMPPETRMAISSLASKLGTKLPFEKFAKLCLVAEESLMASVTKLSDVDLHLDSHDFEELICGIEEVFRIKIPDTEAQKLQTFEQLSRYVESVPSIS